MRRSRMFILAAFVVSGVLSQSSASAIHFYRGTGSGCTPADGALTDDPQDENGNPIHGPIGATIQLWHNSYTDTSGVFAYPNAVLDTATRSGSLLGIPVSRIKVGQAITWTWNSAHCHSVSGSGFDSGFHYPQQAPESPQAVPGFFEYPVLDPSPTLSYTRTFNHAGTFRYSCVHHASIGMTGVIVVAS